MPVVASHNTVSVNFFLFFLIYAVIDEDEDDN